MTRTIPLLDLGRFDRGGPERRGFLEDLRDASRNIGFFCLGGHGVEQSDIDGLFAVSRRFFALPAEEKLSVEMIHSPYFRGYTRVAGELTRGEPDWREQIDFSLECEPVADPGEKPAWARLLGPNQWPASLPELRPAVLAWQSKMTDVSARLLRAFALLLDQQEDVFEPCCRTGPNVRTKIAHYPGRDFTGGDQGVGPHKDSGFLTLLAQDDCGGLQIQSGGAWVDVEPVPGALVVNIGEHLELASGGYLRATLHRAVVPPGRADRYSVACFFSASLDATIPVLTLPEALRRETEAPAADSSNPMFREVGLNVLKTRLRSHPDVARKYYPDLLDDGQLKLAGQPISASQPACSATKAS